MKFDTKVVRASSKPDKITGAVVPPIYQTATYVLDEVGKDKGYDYTRAANPSRQLLEEHLATIEGAKSLAVLSKLTSIMFIPVLALFLMIQFYLRRLSLEDIILFIMLWVMLMRFYIKLQMRKLGAQERIRVLVLGCIL